MANRECSKKTPTEFGRGGEKVGKIQPGRVILPWPGWEEEKEEGGNITRPRQILRSIFNARFCALVIK
jgi:hypothetical protein